MPLSKFFQNGLQKVSILFGNRATANMSGISAQSTVDKFPQTLAGFNVAFNENGELRQIDPATGKTGDQKFEFAVNDNNNYNQRRYEALGEVITDHVYNLLEQNGLKKIFLNADDPNSSFVFSTKSDFRNTDKLLILIHGSGVVRAGQWSRSLIINQSLDKGTQIPYIKHAKKLGYDILITNTNDNFRGNQAITRSESPTKHARNVWDQFISSATNLKHIGIVAHSYGGIVTLDLVKYKFNEFKQLVFGVAFTDSVHSFGGQKDTLPLLRPITRNWVTSDEPIDTVVNDKGGDVIRISAGHTKHEYTSWSAEKSVFEYLENNLQKRRDEL